MDSSWYNRNGLNNNNQNTNKPVSADDPISFMIDLMVSMFTAFAEGVKKGYGKGGNANEKGASATDLQAQQMEQMQNMMQQMMQMFQGMQMMQAQMMRMQQNPGMSLEQDVMPQEKNFEDAKPEEAAAREAKPEDVKPENVKPEEAGKADEKEEVIKEAVVPESKVPEKAAEKPMKWFSEAEIEKSIKAMEALKNEKGKLSYSAERYLKSVKELKSASEANPDGAHVDEYIRVYKGASAFMIDSVNADADDRTMQDARDIARTMRRRLNTNERIDKLESIARLQQEQLEKQAQKEGPKTEKEEPKAQKEEIKKKEPEKKSQREKKIEEAKEKRAEKRLEQKALKQNIPQKGAMGK